MPKHNRSYRSESSRYQNTARVSSMNDVVRRSNSDSDPVAAAERFLPPPANLAFIPQTALIAALLLTMPQAAVAASPDIGAMCVRFFVYLGIACAAGWPTSLGVFLAKCAGKSVESNLPVCGQADVYLTSSPTKTCSRKDGSTYACCASMLDVIRDVVFPGAPVLQYPLCPPGDHRYGGNLGQERCVSIGQSPGLGSGLYWMGNTSDYEACKAPWSSAGIGFSAAYFLAIVLCVHFVGRFVWDRIRMGCSRSYESLDDKRSDNPDRSVLSPSP